MGGGSATVAAATALAELDRAAGLCAGAGRDRAPARTRKREASQVLVPANTGRLAMAGARCASGAPAARLPDLAKDWRYERAPPTGHEPLRLGESPRRRPRPARAGEQGAGIALLGSCCPG